MSFFEEIKITIGDDIYSKLDKLSNYAFSSKYHFHSNSSLGKDSLIEDFLSSKIPICELFEDKGLKISPFDVVNILYKCKLLKSSKSEEIYKSKTTGYNLVDEFDFFILWSKKNCDINALIEENFERLNSFQKTNTLVVRISSFRGNNFEIQRFLDGIFHKLGSPFKAYMDDYTIKEEYLMHYGEHEDYNQEIAKRYFSAPSIGFECFGSMLYCRWFSNMWLKSFISLLKIGGFIYPGQIEFGFNISEMQAPTHPVFLNTASTGVYVWNEDAKEPLLKIPDGCLSRSFGNRSITNMWMDIRNFRLIQGFLFENEYIFQSIKNPWNGNNQKSITPTLDILSSAISSTDIGAKILLVYCCLEHLFVPQGVKTNNKECIIEGITILDNHFLSWFDKLYDCRCDYAHKGYIKRDEQTIEFIKTSIVNILRLLKFKITKIDT